VRSSEAICPNSAWLARAPATGGENGDQERHGDQRQADQHQSTQ